MQVVREHGIQDGYGDGVHHQRTSRYGDDYYPRAFEGALRFGLVITPLSKPVELAICEYGAYERDTAEEHAADEQRDDGDDLRGHDVAARALKLGDLVARHLETGLADGGYMRLLLRGTRFEPVIVVVPFVIHGFHYSNTRRRFQAASRKDLGFGMNC